jgi:hypothetical protein
VFIILNLKIMTSRSATITFINNTDLTLTLINARLSHGVWSHNLYPPEKIEPHGKATWASESDGPMTDTEGTVTYASNAGGDVSIVWYIPYAGSNSYGTSAPKGYTLTHSGGSENNANVTFTLSLAS